ncbi:hypothetical protein WICPIJ_005361 [Wickerhamomyces pijperi]|uniref:Uncharacterized protein n=1 Tax=Wickerhamomyces pijperi TaxID=599730 RepID=A0A9P8Q490_WICPI|nr:hypothetical protein WICPIJ_005361 [Wickerhamomyces pijperi]
MNSIFSLKAIEPSSNMTQFSGDSGSFNFNKDLTFCDGSNSINGGNLRSKVWRFTQSFNDLLDQSLNSQFQLTVLLG